MRLGRVDVSSWVRGKGKVTLHYQPVWCHGVWNFVSTFWREGQAIWSICVKLTIYRQRVHTQSWDHKNFPFWIGPFITNPSNAWALVARVQSLSALSAMFFVWVPFFLSSPYAFGHVGETLKWKLCFQVIFVLFFFMPSVKFFSTNSRLCTEGTHMNNDRKGLKWHKVQIPVALRQWKPQDWIRLFMVVVSI